MGRMRDANPDVIDYIKKLEQRIKNLETNSRASHTSVDTGALKINTTDGSAFEVLLNGVRIFRITGNPDGTPDVRLWRRNGLTAIFMTTFANRDIVGFQDSSLHTILGDDAITGWGLARPWLAIPFYDDLQFAPARTTTSASFVNLQWANYVIQHPFLDITSLVRASDGTTGGEIIVKINGSTVNATITTIPVGSNTLFTQRVALFSYGIDFGSEVELVIAARRTAGAGTIGVRVVGAHGRETELV